MLDFNLILASNSPRRQAMLKELGLAFQVKTKDIDESFSPDLPLYEVPAMLARRKAKAFFEDLQTNDVLLTADTVVICKGQILNKPENFAHACQMLALLSGCKHEVVTAFCLTSATKQICLADTTAVYFRELSSEEISYYVQTYKPYDKAGSYGVQEWIGMTGITRIDGSYFTVVGLPIHLVYKALQEF
jgi:septum formation protein